MQTTLKYVNPPKDGKKMGSIVAEDGTRYFCYPDQYGGCSAGDTVTFEPQQSKFGDSEVMTVAKGTKVVKVGGGGSAPAPKVQSQAEEIFVTGIVGRAMGSGKFTTGDILGLTISAVEAYHLWKSGANPMAPASAGGAQPELEDSIPF